MARGDPDDALLALDAVELRSRLASGALRAEELVEACLKRIDRLEPEIGAWAWRDADFARHQAKELDRRRATGRPVGPLHGLPVGLKDIIDTARIPTENGTEIDAGRVPSTDAWIVTRLREAGAILMGKTATTELAYLHPAKTANPHDASRTPGGSSAGSAAAVAAGMVPLAVGTQTGGSVVRPAAFCGVTGFKPTFGAIPRTGILTQSPSLDTVGVFASTPTGAALIADTLFGFDPADRATAPAPPPQLLTTARAAPPMKPIFAVVRPPGWESADAEIHAAFAELSERLGEQCFDVDLPEVFGEAAVLRERINFAEMAKNYYRYARGGGDKLSEETRAAMKSGAETLARDYLSALDWPDVLNAGLAEIFERADAILTPATLGPAPGRETTGSAIFNGLWTFCGTPALTIPALQSESGLPLGVQMVGARGDDARLLRAANWLSGWLED